MFSYCDNNPIVRVDIEGDLWGTILVGIGVSLASTYASDVLGNIVDGKTGINLIKPTSSVGDYTGAAISGLIPGSGFARSVIRAGTNLVTKCLIDYAIIKDYDDFDIRKLTNSFISGILTDISIDKMSNLLQNMRPKNYSSFSNTVNKNFSKQFSQNTIKKMMYVANNTITVTKFLLKNIAPIFASADWKKD